MLTALCTAVTRRCPAHRFVGTPADFIAARSTLTGEHLAGYVRT